MNKIREKENGYGLVMAVLVIIIIVLISYIAYNKGLDKNKKEDIITTKVETTTTILETTPISREYTYNNICNDVLPCSKEITKVDDLIIKLESNENKHKLVITGSIKKTIELDQFISLRIINNKFFIVKSFEKDKKENHILTLYDDKFNKLDFLNINIYKTESYDNLNLTYYTYNIECPDNQDEYFIKETAIISENGFEISSSNKGPLKTDGIVCKKITTN
ncbi:MAG: hypothetical protein PHD03_03665 [Bacilli bacterium]|nr:hypothetical protein [Bacilli bacterium]MDD4406623.1 hypothetical protein [Bacilli bacterium]